MMYSKAALAMTLLAGAQAQVGVDVNGRECTGEAIEISYENCGRAGSLNVYWTYLAEQGQVNILFESLDDGYASFGFTGLEGLGPMDGANVVLGCHDWEAVPDEVFQILLPEGQARSVNNVAAGIGADNLTPGNLLQVRMNGICGMRFERLTILPDVGGINVDDGQDILSGTPNTVVYARGNAGAIAPAQHSARGAATQDFILGVGDISDAPTIPLLDNPDVVNPIPTEDNSTSIASLSSMQPTPTMTQDNSSIASLSSMQPTPTMTENNSSSIASLSSMLVGAVASLAAALW